MGVKEGKPFHQIFAPKVYETAVKIRSGNYEEIVGVGIMELVSKTDAGQFYLLLPRMNTNSRSFTALMLAKIYG